MKLIFTFFALFIVNSAFSQSDEMLRVLDVEKYADCELFAQKKGYDREQRLEEIKALGGKQVSVFYLKGKSGKIALNIYGLVDLTSIEESGLPLKNLTDVLSVISNSGGHGVTKFPPTNDKNVRIYLTECFEKVK